MNRCPPGVDSSFFSIQVLPGQRRQRHDPSRSFPVDLRCQHGSTRFTQVGLPFPVLQGSPRWFLTCQKPPERPPVHPGPSGIIPVHHGGTTVQPPVLPGSPRSMDRGEPGSTGSPVGLMHYMCVLVDTFLENHLRISLEYLPSILECCLVRHRASGMISNDGGNNCQTCIRIIS